MVLFLSVPSFLVSNKFHLSFHSGFLLYRGVKEVGTGKVATLCSPSMESIAMNVY